MLIVFSPKVSMIFEGAGVHEWSLYPQLLQFSRIELQSSGVKRVRLFLRNRTTVI